MRPLKFALCLALLGCDHGGPSDAGAADAVVADAATDVIPRDAPANDAVQTDAQGDATLSDVGDAVDASSLTFECDALPTFVATSAPVSALTQAGSYLLVGTTAALESRRTSARAMDLDIIGREAFPVVNLSAGGGHVVAFDGSDARLFTVEGDGALNVAGRFDVSGRSVLAVRDLQVFAFRYPLAARINTFEARSLENLTSPASLGEVQVEGTGPVDVRLAAGRAYALDAVESRLSVIDVSAPGAMSVLSTLGIPDVIDSSKLVVTDQGVFVGIANSLVHVEHGGSAVTGESEGGALVTELGGLLATASSTRLFIYRLNDAGPVQVANYEFERAPTALLWTEDALIVGNAAGLQARRCGLR